ncbi:recombinase family protein [Streptomyces daliensis]|uniref:Recombinase family protein n=1 Tax=Streptomyces daliensis TaxID=299421 RepID=A0A8T4ISZ8_9ACTN|nr:recombinase family protein [Streptomyces daliensis]
MSEDGSRDSRSVDSQHADNTEGCEEHGITLGVPYTDNGISASRFSTKSRDDFVRLVADLENDMFGAEVLVLWENSRGSRKVSEWALLIELLEAKGVRVFVTCDNRLYDPAVPADRKILQSAAIDSEQESYKTSMRNRRTAKREAQKGRPYGRAPQGYMPVYDPQTGDLVNWVENPDESHVPKQLFTRLRKGHSLRSIAKDFEKRGYRTRTGKPFSEQHLRDMALRPTYGGYRGHSPKSRGNSFKAKHQQVELAKATWDGLVDEETFWAVRRMLLAPERRTTRTGRAKYELTGTITCGVCSGKTTIKTKGYQCDEKGCVHLSKAKVDEYLIGTADEPGLILAYLSSDQVYQDFAASPQDEGRVTQIRADLARLRAEKAETEGAEPETLAEARMFARTVANLEKKITKLEAEERALTMPSVLSDLIQPGADVAARWAQAPVSARRQVARLLLCPEVLGEVVIIPGRNLSVAERLQRRRSQPDMTQAA